MLAFTGGWKTTFLLGRQLFRGYVKLQGGTHFSWNISIAIKKHTDWYGTKQVFGCRSYVPTKTLQFDMYVDLMLFFKMVHLYFSTTSNTSFWDVPCFTLKRNGRTWKERPFGPQKERSFPQAFFSVAFTVIVLGSVIGSTVKSWNLPGAVLADAARDIASWSSMQRLGGTETVWRCSYGLGVAKTLVHSTSYSPPY